MTSTVGFPDRLHPETLACTNLEEAKVFVNVDVSKTLPKEIEFSKEGKEFTVEFHYPWLPARCYLCEKWDHTERVCVKRGKAKNKSDDLIKSGEKSKEGKKEQAKGLEVSNEESKEEGMKENQEESNNNQEKSPVSNWKFVSPEKVGRSPLENVTEVLISASKFAVLNMDDVEEVEEGEIEDDKLESYLEDNLEDMDKLREIEGDLLEDDILEQQSRGKDKAVTKKRVEKGAKGKSSRCKSG